MVIKGKRVYSLTFCLGLNVLALKYIYLKIHAFASVIVIVFLHFFVSETVHVLVLKVYKNLNESLQVNF